MWVTDDDDQKIYAYSLPEPVAEDLSGGISVHQITADSVLVIVDQSYIAGSKKWLSASFKGPGLAYSLAGTGTWFRSYRLKPDTEYTVEIYSAAPSPRATGLTATFHTTYVKVGGIEVGDVTTGGAEVTVDLDDVGGRTDHAVYLRYRPDGGQWSAPLSEGGSGYDEVDQRKRFGKVRFSLTGLDEATTYEVQAYLDPDNPAGSRTGQSQTETFITKIGPPRVNAVMREIPAPVDGLHDYGNRKPYTVVLEWEPPASLDASENPRVRGARLEGVLLERKRERVPDGTDRAQHRTDQTGVRPRTRRDLFRRRPPLQVQGQRDHE